MMGFYVRYAILDYFRTRYPIQKYMKYKLCQNLLFEDLPPILLYEEDEHIKRKMKKKKIQYGRYNVEHVWCKKYFHHKGIQSNDLHNLFLAKSEENTKRSDYPFCFHSYKSPFTYKPHASSIPYILSSLSYYFIYDPQFASNHFSDVIDNDTFLIWLYQHPEIDTMLIKRNEKIGEIQGNYNPFVRYPILYCIFFDDFRVWMRIKQTWYIQKKIWKLKSKNFSIIKPHKESKS